MPMPNTGFFINDFNNIRVDYQSMTIKALKFCPHNPDKNSMKIGFFKREALPRLIEKLEESIEKRKILKIVTGSSSLKLFPHRLVYLQGELSLVGENAQARQLQIFNIKEIKTSKLLEEEYQNNLSAFDIDHFIDASRKMSDLEYRLVLKLSHSFLNIDLDPKFHFFGNPCLVSNSQGELIWGASVELNEELLKWLADIKQHVRIVDPLEIKKALNEYLMKKNLD